MECGTKPECAEIADRAVRKTFAILGVNIDNPESVEEFRQDLRFGKKAEKDKLTTVRWPSLRLLSIAIVGAIWIGIVSSIKGE
jgi:hypothetical protein